MRYFVAPNIEVVRNFADKQKLGPSEYTWVHDSIQLKGLRDIVLECLPGYADSHSFYELYSVALSRNIKVEIAK